jgi:hypothetical protein
LLITDTISKNGDTRSVVEYDTIELVKALHRLGERLEIPDSVTLLASEDMYINLPVVCHGGQRLQESLRKTTDALRLLLRGLANRGKGHYVTFTVAWQATTKEVRVSVAGSTADCATWLDERGLDLPVPEERLSEWLEKSSDWLGAARAAANDVPPLGELLQTTGVLWFRRRPLPEDIEITPHFSDQDKALVFDLNIPQKYTRTAELLKSGQIRVAPAFFVRGTKCSKCGNRYETCEHSRFMDPGVFHIMDDITLALAFWTDKHA